MFFLGETEKQKKPGASQKHHAEHIEHHWKGRGPKESTKFLEMAIELI